MLDTSVLERPLPQNLEAEKTVLGSVLIEPMAWTKVLGAGLRAEHFYRDGHRKIFGALTDLAARGTEVDIVTLKNELARRGEIDAAGGASYLSSLIDGIPDVANVEHYTAIVKEKSVLRRLILAGQTIAREAMSGSITADDVLATAEKGIFEIADEQVEGGFQHIGPITEKNLEALERAGRQHGMLTGLATGFEKLDEMTYGLQRSDLIIVAARPSMGKTSWVLNIAEHMAIRENLAVAFFSLEMSAAQLGLRLLGSQSRVSGNHIRGGMLSQEQWSRLALAQAKIAKAPLYIEDTAGMGILEMRAKVRRLKMEQGRLDCIMVDYLQLMSEKRRFENRNLEISAISRGMKALAKEMNVPLIALSQLSRKPEQRTGDHRPQLGDLRESGAIEQDADVVAFIYRDEVYNPDSEFKGIAEIIVAKQRNGPIGSFKLVFLNDITRFENMDPSSERG